MPTPGLGITDEEQLLVVVALKAGQPLLLSALFGQEGSVGGQGLFDAPIVGNVLALCEDAIHSQAGVRHLKRRILVNDALLQYEGLGINSRIINLYGD